MNDILLAYEDTEHALCVTLYDGFSSLKVAVRATEFARSLSIVGSLKHYFQQIKPFF